MSKFVSKKSKAIDMLVNQGLALTEGELALRLNTTGAGARGVIRQVRNEGFAVYKNKGTKDAQGRIRASRYRVGTPSRAMVAAFYANEGAKKGRLAK